MKRSIFFWGLALGMASGWGLRAARAQGPTIDSSLPSQPGAGGSTLGNAPGSGGGALGNAPGTMGGQGNPGGILSGRPGPTAPRIDPGQPSAGSAVDLSPSRIAPIPSLPNADLPIYGSLALPKSEDEGPPNGMTLDQAIDLLLKNNIDLRSKFYEIPQAQADILTASLRSNPVFYADAQLVPYGQYTKSRPGGQTQYDVNISYPLDVSQKRKARTVSAVAAKRVIEAQYQDAVRQAIDNLYTVFVNVVAARETISYQVESLKGLDDLLAKTKELVKRDFKAQAEYDRILNQRNQASIALEDARTTLQKAKVELANQLNLPAGQADALEVRGSILDRGPAPPTLDEMTRTAVAFRPDVVAYRLGITSALANVKLQKTNRLQDIYVLYQPYTLQDNTPFGLKSPTSWALGVTVPLPIYNRNQGAIRRAELNVTQTQIEAQNIERGVVRDVQSAEKEYTFTRIQVEQLERDVVPAAERVYSATERLYRAGEASAIDVLNARKERNDTVKLYRDALVRHRRSMLDLNTAVGQRLLP